MASVPARQGHTTRIVRDPAILGGEPTVAGTRVPVRSIVVGFQRYDGNVVRVARAYRLDVEAVRDALTYYEAHRQEIDALIRDNDLAAETPEA